MFLMYDTCGQRERARDREEDAGGFQGRHPPRMVRSEERLPGVQPVRPPLRIRAAPNCPSAAPRTRRTTRWREAQRPSGGVGLQPSWFADRGVGGGGKDREARSGGVRWRR